MPGYRISITVLVRSCAGWARVARALLAGRASFAAPPRIA